MAYSVNGNVIKKDGKVLDRCDSHKDALREVKRRQDFRSSSISIRRSPHSIIALESAGAVEVYDIELSVYKSAIFVKDSFTHNDVVMDGGHWIVYDENGFEVVTEDEFESRFSDGSGDD